MKKLISLLAALAVVSTCSFSALAADFTVDYDTTVEGTDGTLTATDVTTPTAYTKGTDGLYTVDLTTVAGTQEQTTILAVEGTTISVGSIKFIDQSATPSFSFDMDDPTSQVYVLAGGSAINPTYVGYIAPASTETETFTISGTVSGYGGTALPTVTVSDGTNSYTAEVKDDNTFSVDVPILESGSYTLTATKTSHLSYTLTDLATTKDDVVAIVKAGDINTSGQADILDISAIINVFNSKTGDTNYNIKNDLNESGQCDILDISAIINNFNKQNIVESASAK